MPISGATRQSAFDPTNIVPGIVIAALAVLLIRLWYLQVVRGDEYSREAAMRREIRTTIQSPRGMIVDRRGRPIAIVKPRLAVMVVPDELSRQKNAIPKLANILGEQVSEIEEQIKANSFRKHLPFVLKTGITMEQAVAIEEQKIYIPGANVATVTVRSYPTGGSCAHVVGYVGMLTKDDLDRYETNERTPPTFAGHAGIERRYDLNLVGEPGVEKISVDSRGRKTGPPEISRPIVGDKILLSIDLALQTHAKQLLSGHKGAIVALDPKSGQILCMASGPTFDPNIFTRRLSTAEWNAVGKNPSKPMLNRATGGAFGPGSTLKMLTLVAAIKAGVATPQTSFVCHRRMVIGTTTFRCLGDHGTVDYQKALRESCNIYFASLALKLDRRQILETAEQFGFGKQTGVDLLSEVKGTIPTDKVIANRKMRWYPGDNMNLAVGQGVVSVTPIQMAQYASILANNGVGFRPTVLLSRVPSVAESKAQTQFLPEETNHVDLSPEWWSRIRQAMVAVVESGTGQRARIQGVQIAGKTGSADWDAKQRSHAWFVGYAPANDPKIAFAIVIEAVGRGGTEAAPLARALVQTYLNSR